MQTTRIGSSGLDVSTVTLGCMSFGEPDVGNHGWTLPEEESRGFIQRALELGFTSFDTANAYSAGRSEEIVGAALADFAQREDVVIATKVFMPMRDGVNGRGLSRGHILESVHASLRRLGTDYIDLFQIHRFDPTVPVEETMQTLDDVVRSGKVRYVGASSMWAWQFAKLQHAAELHGWTRFISMQAQYNLLTREDEREMYPLCLDQGVGALPWSPLARGKLTRPWDAESARFATDALAPRLYRQAEDSDRRIVDAVLAIAAEREVRPAQIALAWVLAQPVVSSPIVGATRMQHLDDAVAASELVLTDDELRRLEEHYVPHAMEGFA